MKACAGFGLREEDIVQLVLNPTSGKPISPVTLRAHFRQELDSGHALATSKVASSLFKNATTATETYPGGIPVAQIFWMKVRGKWKDRPDLVPPPAPQDPGAGGMIEHARRVAFVLAQGFRQKAAVPSPAPPKAPPPAAKKPKVREPA